MPAHDVPLDSVLESEDDCDSGAVDSRQDKLAEFMRLLMIGSNDEETDEDESGSDEDTDTDSSSSDADDGDSSSEESAEDMESFHWQRHPKPMVSQASIDQEWRLGRPKGKSALAAPKSVSSYDPQTRCKSVS